MSAPANTPWTDARVATLTRMWRDGFSAGAIADKLGGVSHHAVIGKAHRLGLGQHPNAPINRIGQAPRAPRKPAQRQKPSVAPRTGQPVPAAPEPPVARLKPVKPITLMQLRNGVTRKDGTFIPGTCKWPIGDPGDPDFGFCGAPPVRGIPYCLYHARIAYRPRKREVAA